MHKANKIYTLMNKINFLAKDSFPASIETFDRMQQATNMVATLALLGGSNYILSGCEEKEGQIQPGIIVVAGEILPFVGGSPLEFIKIQETKRELEAFDELYPEAYIDRVVTFSADGILKWESVKRIISNQELLHRLDSIRGDDPGTVKMWAGQISKIPKDYMLCDGSPLENEKYPELKEILGAAYGVDGSNSFKLPDLRNRFVVGYNNANDDYNLLGKIGGEARIVLTEDQLPPHSHSFLGVRKDSNNWRGTGEAVGSYTVYEQNQTTDSTGKGESHENRPPYFVLAYIIKVK